MHHRLLVIFLISLFAIAPIASPALAQSTPPDAEEPDNTVIHIYVHENGSADWVFQTRTRLATDADTASFEAFQRDYQNDSSARLDDFQGRMTGVVEAANETTGREMEVRGFETRAFVQEVPRRWGVVEFQFLWNGFATHTEWGLTVGDVFDGGWFLSDTDTLVIHTPPGHTITSSSPTPDSTADGAKLLWNGPLTFADDRPEVAFATTDASETPGDDTSLSLVVILGGLALLIIVILGTTVYWHRRGTEKAATASTTRTPPMTDSERVLDLLRKNGGRMKQADIDAEFEWSKSKTSLIISNLAEEDKVAKVRLGRENLITLVEAGE